MTETLLGGSGGDIPPQSKLENLDITPEAYKKLRPLLSQLLQNVLSGGEKGNTSLTDALAMIPSASTGAAPITSGEQSALDALIAGINPSSGATAASGLLTDTLGGKYLNPDSNPYLAQSIEDAIAPLRQEYQDTIMPNLRIGFTQSGQTINPNGSSVFDRASALAANEYMRNVSATATKIASDNYTAERDRQAAAVDQQTALDTSKVNNLVSTLNAVALPRLIEQYGIDAGVEEFRTRMQSLLQLLGLSAGSSGVSNAGVQGSEASTGVLGDLIQGGAAMGAAYMASDRRLKRDIRPLAKVKGWPQLYEFRYIGQRLMRWGFMADELPKSVQVDFGGYLGIDLRKVRAWLTSA